MSVLNAAVEHKIRLILVATALSLGSPGLVANAQVTPTNIPVVGCQGSVIPADTDAEINDDEEDAADDASEHAPAIVGTIKAPRGMKENDKRLNGLPTISSSQARAAALAAISDADQRRVRSVEVEIEQGYVIYAVKTQLRGAGVDPELEVKVDAGNGAVLLIECDPGDN